MKIALVCYLSNPTYWVAKYVVELENNLNFYIRNELDHYDKLTYSFFMGILYVDSAFSSTTIPRKMKHDKLKKQYEFDVKNTPKF